MQNPNHESMIQNNININPSQNPQHRLAPNQSQVPLKWYEHYHYIKTIKNGIHNHTEQHYHPLMVR